MSKLINQMTSFVARRVILFTFYEFEQTKGERTHFDCKNTRVALTFNDQVLRHVRTYLWVFADGKMNLAFLDDSTTELVQKTTDALVGVFLKGIGQLNIVSRENELGARIDGVGHKEGRRRRIARNLVGGESRCRQGSQQEQQERTVACHCVVVCLNRLVSLMTFVLFEL